ncbi:MAG: exporter of the superfamily protein-like protein [Gammaproteobacteria bacterium]|jgi:predicted RND superfamily exporter protein|nr:exporter of the superfamily protein-like protein [Gammaproteobacteria bacterium]
MSVPASPQDSKVFRFFLRVLHMRGRIVGAFLILTVAGIYGATLIPNDPAIDRLVVAGDPVARATLDFDRLFPEGDQALIMLEGTDPLSPAALRTADQLERQLAKIPGVKAHSLLDFFRRADPAAEISAHEAERLRPFATGTALFRRAGLLGDHYLGIGFELRVSSPQARNRALAAIDSLVLPLEKPEGPFTVVRRVGSPWLNAWLEHQTGVATKKFMPLFGIFLVALVLIVYRSLRALGAIIVTLGSVVAIAVGLAAIFGWSNTVVSTLVPLTVMVTTTATLVYIHSRYMEPDDAPTRLEHHAGALANKFLPSTASMFATAVGFAALAVSEIRPVREMGLWTAAGLVVAWVACFTLFPALQSLFRTPLRSQGARVGRRFARFVDVLVPATNRYRWPLVIGAVVMMLCGAAALFGIPGRLAPLALETDALTYVNPSERVAQDTRRFQEFNGLDVVDLWVKTPPGHALDPEFLRAIEHLTQRLEADPRITAVDGPTSVLRWARYLQSGTDKLPTDAPAWSKLAADLEQIMLTEPAARDYVDITDLASVRLSIRGRAELFGRTGAMRKFVERTWRGAKEQEPALQTAQGLLVGKGVVSTEITERLLPTLTESFALTASIIFCAFLVVFRSPSARLMTMIPSLFAILSVFLVMRLTGIPLNIATILIGSTVLGATENDQVHFFYHFLENRPTNSTGGALQHAMLIAGRPILFATLINASGFLALSFSDLPPMRQFGIVTASAFVLALLADFTALPGALWILSRYERHPAPRTA